MKKLLKKVMMCATMMALVLGFSAKEGDYTHTLYTIRWFLYDGKGSLRMENGTILQPNDRYLLENETFRLYYTSASTDAHKFIVVIEDSNGNSQTLTFNFNNENKKDDEDKD